MLVALREGIGHPAFGIAFTLLVIVVLDAGSLRRQVGHHAAALNRVLQDDPQHSRLRERMGHSIVEIAAGLLTGLMVAALVHAVLPPGLSS